MSLFKCKMCGGDLEIVEGVTIAECEYCGTKQTVPKLYNDKRINMYDRANHFRRNNEFDKAKGIYENILNEDNTDAEAYWSLILCNYGIEYVEDPVTHKRIPTINRAQFTSIFDDVNYKSAVKYADIQQRLIYEEEAKTINEIQKSILSISEKEDPFDVFICYKETDNNGRRTQDSVFAQDLYYQLKQEGFKVFFSRITLEDKLGSAYEPYIFAALNSSKVMIVLGTKPEHFNAIWVKNEWSRYIGLIKQGKKKVLIPAYKDMDPYNLPEEFSHLQAQDMSKLGFMQDLIRGIKKIVNVDEKAKVRKETIVTSSNANVSPLIKRIFMFLEDSKWTEANEYCEKVLDIDPECGEAYLGKLLAELKVNKKEDLKKLDIPLDNAENYNKIMRYGSESLIEEIKQYDITIRNRIEENRKESIYKKALELSQQQIPERQIEASKQFEKILGFKDSDARAKECLQQVILLKYNFAMKAYENITTSDECIKVSKMFKEISNDYALAKEKTEKCLIKAEELAEIERKNDIYHKALFAMEIGHFDSAIGKLQTIIDWKDSKEKLLECEKLKEKQMQEEKITDRKNKIKRIILILCSISIIILSVSFLISNELGKGLKYELNSSKNGYSVIGIGTCTDADIVIPSTYKALPVTSIEKKAFYGCSNLKKIEIPDSVQYIGAYAFSRCTNLTSITIPKSVIYIGEYAFYGCTNLKKIEIPDSVQYIGAYAFSRCTNLKKIEIPDSVASIENNTFDGCISLERITIPNSVKKIGNYAFQGCKYLDSIEIPNSVTMICNYAFYGCENLTIYCESKSKPKSWQSAWCFKSTFLKCSVVWGYKSK